MSKTYLKSDHFNGGGSAVVAKWEGERVDLAELEAALAPKAA
jgi:predicted ATP-dependent serine protease